MCQPHFRKKIKIFFIEKTLDKNAELWYNGKLGADRPSARQAKQKAVFSHCSAMVSIYLFRAIQVCAKLYYFRKAMTPHSCVSRSIINYISFIHCYHSPFYCYYTTKGLICQPQFYKFLLSITKYFVSYFLSIDFNFKLSFCVAE